jgi:predicted nucleic acid-binding protein
VALIVLDTSILVALLDAGDRLHPAATAAVTEAWDAGAEVLVPSTAYGEAMVRPLQVGGDALGCADAFFASQTIVGIERREAREAARLRGAHRTWLRMPDALVLATALVRDAAALTGDTRWSRVSPLVRIVGSG